MQKEWECKKCGYSHDPQGGSSMWKCASCGALRWPGMVWGGAGVLIVFLVIGIWALFPSEKPEEKFLAQVKLYLQGDAATEGDVTSDEAEKLKTLATRLKLTNRLEELIKQGKLDYLTAKKDSLRKSLNLPQGQEIPSKELQPVCDLARRMGMVAEVKGCSKLEDITAHLNQGEFAKARDLLRSMPDDPQGKKVLNEMETPLVVEANFQFQKDGQTPSPIQPVDSQELSNLLLTNRDNYRLHVSVSLDRVYLYIFQKDQYGEIKRVFPDPIWSRGVDNPVQKAISYQLPSEKEWFYVDELPAAQTDAIAESLYFIASPWKAKDIEQLYGKIYEATTPETRKDLIQKFIKQLQLRNDPTFKSLYYKEFSFEHGK